MNRLSLRLYIAGDSVRSEAAARNLRRLLDEIVGSDYELKIVDVIRAPAQAEQALVLATPTLIKYQPLPVRRIIGDLSDRDALFSGLDLDIYDDKKAQEDVRS
ncbi:MAG: circadian clock KaiB family protein [Granulosicoccus sp.]|nr:circadian clock KaiB family protein [Granulosicoccus sp.]